MGLVSGGSGGGGPAAGSYLPAGSKTGVTLDTTTYDDTIRGNGKLATLVFATEGVGLAMALTGDAFPRVLFTANPEANGIYFFNGTADASVSGCEIYDHNGEMRLGSPSQISLQAPLLIQAPQAGTNPPTLRQLSPYLSITSGALPTVTITSGTGRQVSVASDVETVTPFTGDGTNNAATCAIALSADNVTYSTLATISIAAALNLTGVLTDTVNCRVPAGWYIKLTVVHGTLGTTTYY